MGVLLDRLVARCYNPLVADRRRSGKLKFSDIDLDRWKDYDDVLTDTWWDLGRRASGNGHKLDYHGNFVPQIVTQIYKRYTKEHDIVVDWFLGSGTSAIEALNMNRRLIGVELKRDLIDHVANKIPPDKIDSTIKLIRGDSASRATLQKVTQALHDLGSEHAQLVILHPPYADIIRFSNLKADLSNCESTEQFLRRFRLVARSAFATLEPGRFAVLVIGDKYSKGELDPLGFRCMQVMSGEGFAVKSIVVKNIEGNEVGKGKDNSLWRYRALKGGFYVFKHEYVIIFRRPDSKSLRRSIT